MAKAISRKKREGFTLIELVVVIGILAVLAVVAIRAFSGQGEGARNSQHMGYLTQIDGAATQYMSEYGKGDLTTFAKLDENHPLVQLNFIKAAPNPWASTAETWKGYNYYVGVVDIEKTVGGVTKTVPKVVVYLGADDKLVKTDENPVKLTAVAYLQMNKGVPTVVTATAGDSPEKVVNIIE